MFDLHCAELDTILNLFLTFICCFDDWAFLNQAIELCLYIKPLHTQNVISNIFFFNKSANNNETLAVLDNVQSHLDISL